MKYTEAQLIEKKKEIETAKTESAELNGELKGLLKRLKESYKCSTLKEAKEMLKKMEKASAKLDNEIQAATKEIEETYFNEEE